MKNLILKHLDKLLRCPLRLTNVVYVNRKIALRALNIHIYIPQHKKNNYIYIILSVIRPQYAVNDVMMTLDDFATYRLPSKSF